MKKISQTFTVVAIILLVTAIETVGVPHRLKEIKGQIIAYRPADRVLQEVSHVLNKESFLFRVSDSESSSHAAIIKLVYEHVGYSDVGDDVLSKTPILRINIRRDTTCDETYGAFVQNSPILTDNQAKDGSSERVVFIGPFQQMKLAPEQPLKCYKLQGGNFQVDPSVSSH